ncbi:hypothetical protein PRIC1_014374 [Phytophthora ramorum]
MKRLAVHMWTAQGTREIYSGLGATISRITPYMGLSYGIYSTLNEVSVESRKKQEQDEPDGWMSLSTARSCVGSGAVAGLLSKLVVCPLGTAKKRMQMHHVPRCQPFDVLSVYSSSWSCFFDVLSYEGAGFTKAQFPV